LEQCKDSYLLFDRLIINRTGEVTCPVRSLAVFAHNQDIEYDSVSGEVLRLLDDCTSEEEVIALRDRYPDLIPPVIKDSTTSEANQGVIMNTVLFDQTFYQTQK
jgi:hypothetical protein